MTNFAIAKSASVYALRRPFTDKFKPSRTEGQTGKPTSDMSFPLRQKLGLYDLSRSDRSSHTRQFSIMLRDDFALRAP